MTKIRRCSVAEERLGGRVNEASWKPSSAPEPTQIGSDPASGSKLGFQDASFTLPPNRSSVTEHRQIFVISDDSDTRPNEDDKEREN